MRIGGIVLGVLAIAALATKLFTYEFFLKDDPASGIALRPQPGFVSHQELQKSGSSPDHVLVRDENGFAGETMYRALVNWGWVVFCVAWPVVAWQGKKAAR